MAFYEDKNTLWCRDLHVFAVFPGSVLIDCHINLYTVKFVVMLDGGYSVL